jgi:hypothetical protein
LVSAVSESACAEKADVGVATVASAATASAPRNLERIYLF